MEEQDTTDNIIDISKDPLEGVATPVVSPIRTFRADLVDIAHNGDQSLAQMVLKSQERKRKAGNRESIKISEHESHKKIVKMALILLLLVPTLIVLAFVVTKDPQLNNRSIQVIGAPIAANSHHNISVNKLPGTFLASLQTHIDDVVLRTGDVQHIYITDDVIRNPEKAVDIFPTTDFINLWAENPPSPFTRSLSEDEYMLGLHKDRGDAKPSHFIIFKTYNHDSTFAGILQWEARMILDFKPLFNQGSPIPKGQFVDELLYNKRARILYDIQDNPLLIYSFLDRETLVITDSEKTFREIELRLRLANTIKR